MSRASVVGSALYNADLDPDPAENRDADLDPDPTYYHWIGHKILTILLF